MWQSERLSGTKTSRTRGLPGPDRVHSPLSTKDIDSLVLHSQCRSEDPYACVGSRLAKKGLVKKLLDNLTSHKSNLYECSHQIF